MKNINILKITNALFRDSYSTVFWDLVLIFGEYQEFELQKISSFWKILGFFENKEIKLPIANALLGDSYSTVFWDQV